MGYKKLVTWQKLISVDWYSIWEKLSNMQLQENDYWKRRGKIKYTSLITQYLIKEDQYTPARNIIKSTNDG